MIYLMQIYTKEVCNETEVLAMSEEKRIQEPLFPEVYFVSPIHLKIDGKEERHYALYDQRGHLYSKQDVSELWDAIKSFYGLENIEEWIDQQNKLKSLRGRLKSNAANYSSTVRQNENGLYELPEPNFKYKLFNREKREWSCKCNWCGEKVSSKEHEGYYTLNNSIFEIHFERACSEVCVRLIWQDKVKEWIFDNNYQEFFHLNK